jgi:predicted GIY-YIG superfamily endonuclease
LVQKLRRQPVQSLQQRFWPDPRPLVERLGEDFFRQLPECPGVYLMRGGDDAVLYVGKAKNLRHRLGSYRVANPDRMGRRHLRLLRQVVRIELQECADEPAALAREAELLRALKPKFNRAGVWPGTPQFLVWRRAGRMLELAITKTPAPGWQVHGPFGGGAVYLRAALVRLLWYAENPMHGAIAMPEGWWHGRLGPIAAIEMSSSEMESMLAKLLAGDAVGFTTWIGEKTQSLALGYDRETRDADLETVVSLIQVGARRTLPFQTPDQARTGKRVTLEGLLPFSDVEWTQP